MPAPKKTLTSAELCELLEVKPPTVSGWVAAGCPHVLRGNRYSFVLARVADWREERARRAARDDVAPDEAAERVRKLRAEADRLELTLARERREVVPAADVLAAAEEEAARVRGVLTQLHTEYAPLLASRLACGLREASAVLREISDGVCARLAAPDDSDVADAA